MGGGNRSYVSLSVCEDSFRRPNRLWRVCRFSRGWDRGSIRTMSEKRHIRYPALLAFAADYFAIVAAYFLTWRIRFRSEWGETLFTLLNRWLGVRTTGVLPEWHEDFYLASALRITSLIASVLIPLYGLRNMYAGRRFITHRPVAWNVLLANAVALGLFYVYFYLTRNVFHPRSFFATMMVLNVALCLFFRGALERLLRHLRKKGFDTCRAMLLGQGREAHYLHVFLTEFQPHGIRIVAEDVWNPPEDFSRWLARIEARCREEDIEMVIAAQKDLPLAHVMRLLDTTGRLDIPAKILTDSMRVLVDRAHIPTDTILGTPLVHFESPSHARGFEPVQRVCSVLFAGTALVFLAPLVGIVALVIKLTSRGPVFFVQERIGAHQKPFRMVKFRTMYHGADRMQAEVEALNESDDTLFKIRRDPRITPAGRLLRRFSLDELPQLLHVCRGEMLLVGPRPLPRRDFERYGEKWHYSRHEGMPGLTGLWQVSGRSDLDFQSMCILDSYYLRNRSWVLDLRILLRTLWSVLFAQGAY